MDVAERYIPVEGGKVYSCAFGRGSKTPILVLHGGPGFSHTLLLPVQELARDRRVIFYDQLGSGKSDRPDDLSLWNTERFVRELGQVRQALGLDRVILLGASWGTMLAVDYMLTDPAGVEALILSSPCLSARMWKEDADRLRLLLPTEVQERLLRHEAAGTTASEEYQAGVMEYIKRFACRLDPLPQGVLDAIADANMQVYTHMWGPSEFHPTGTLKDYDRTSELSRIRVPALFTCGRHDEATPESTRRYQSLVPGAELTVFENSSHMAVIEEPEAYLGAIRSFLDRIGPA
jgi:proline iminopeptidase